ncbi:hypothetical protein [Neisseria sp.]|uniref:hypothetical protein n=1 Tax=Neisseria sp. TaxID=192066 RepID=UPI0026DA83AE|nr:hypothetical protein [Neisseria sp.]MDO4226978.1 hypothetical protein [Neisseria sp.]
MMRAAANPLYITPHHAHAAFAAAFQALNGLAACYPAVWFGMLLDGGKWLVFRIREQYRRGITFDAPASVSDGLFSDNPNGKAES